MSEVEQLKIDIDKLREHVAKLEVRIATLEKGQAMLDRRTRGSIKLGRRYVVGRD